MTNLGMHESQRVAKATGQPAAKLLAPTLAKAAPSLERRRLMPLRHVAMQMGNAAAITYCIQQRPPLLPLTQVRGAARICLLVLPLCAFSIMWQDMLGGVHVAQ